jgi:hypothetical protein
MTAIMVVTIRRREAVGRIDSAVSMPGPTILPLVLVMSLRRSVGAARRAVDPRVTWKRLGNRGSQTSDHREYGNGYCSQHLRPPSKSAHIPVGNALQFIIRHGPGTVKNEFAK